MKTLLLVEDHDDNRELFRRLLEGKGWRVLEARDGQEAVEKAVQHRDELHLILMDLNLPVLNGFEATSRILGQPETSHLPVIAMSAHCWEFDWREQAQSVGCVECVSKPLDFELLDRVLAQHART